MLGQELETYKGNKLIMVVGSYCWRWDQPMLVYSAFTTTPADNAYRIIALAVFVLPAFLFVWLNSLRVTLHSDGITYHTLFRDKEMRWDMLERFRPMR